MQNRIQRIDLRPWKLWNEHGKRNGRLKSESLDFLGATPAAVVNSFRESFRLWRGVELTMDELLSYGADPLPYQLQQQQQVVNVALQPLLQPPPLIPPPIGRVAAVRGQQQQQGTAAAAAAAAAASGVQGPGPLQVVALPAAPAGIAAGTPLQEQQGHHMLPVAPHPPTQVAESAVDRATAARVHQQKQQQQQQGTAAAAAAASGVQGPGPLQVVALPAAPAGIAAGTPWQEQQGHHMLPVAPHPPTQVAESAVDRAAAARVHQQKQQQQQQGTAAAAAAASGVQGPGPLQVVALPAAPAGIAAGTPWQEQQGHHMLPVAPHPPTQVAESAVDRATAARVHQQKQQQQGTDEAAVAASGGQGHAPLQVVPKALPVIPTPHKHVIAIVNPTTKKAVEIGDLVAAKPPMPAAEAAVNRTAAARGQQQQQLEDAGTCMEATFASMLPSSEPLYQTSLVDRNARSELESLGKLERLLDIQQQQQLQSKPLGVEGGWVSGEGTWGGWSADDMIRWRQQQQKERQLAMTVTGPTATTAENIAEGGVNQLPDHQHDKKQQQREDVGNEAAAAVAAAADNNEPLSRNEQLNKLLGGRGNVGGGGGSGRGIVRGGSGRGIVSGGSGRGIVSGGSGRGIGSGGSGWGSKRRGSGRGNGSGGRGGWGKGTGGQKSSKENKERSSRNDNRYCPILTNAASRSNHADSTSTRKVSIEEKVNQQEQQQQSGQAVVQPAHREVGVVRKESGTLAAGMGPPPTRRTGPAATYQGGAVAILQQQQSKEGPLVDDMDWEQQSEEDHQQQQQQPRGYSAWHVEEMYLHIWEGVSSGGVNDADFQVWQEKLSSGGVKDADFQKLRETVRRLISEHQQSAT